MISELGFCTFAMECETKERANEAHQELKALGYRFDHELIWTSESYILLLNTVNEGEAFFVHPGHSVAIRIGVIAYNFPILRALAAMKREGWNNGELYKTLTGSIGEVVYTTGDYVIANQQTFMGKMRVAFNPSEENNVKLTAEEIMQHFSESASELAAFSAPIEHTEAHETISKHVRNAVSAHLEGLRILNREKTEEVAKFLKWQEEAKAEMESAKLMYESSTRRLESETAACDQITEEIAALEAFLSQH